MSDSSAQRDFCNVVDEMTQSISSVRESIKSLRVKQNTTSELDFQDGISLLSLKHHIMLQYLQSIVLLTSHRALGHSMEDRTPPTQPFGHPVREARGSAAGDAVDSMIEGRVVLEKVKVLEGRMKYQIEKLVKVAEDATSGAQTSSLNDPLAFRPNPSNLMAANSDVSASDSDVSPSQPTTKGDGIYRPPKLAPMPYIEPTSKHSKRTRLPPPPSALTSLTHLDPSKPHLESASGLGNTPSLSSSRAREIARMTEFEEENMMRLVMKKKDAKKRAMDEADIALGLEGGGALGGGRGGRRRAGGLEDEFGDVLRSVGRRREGGGGGDGYEELRKRGRKEGVLERSRARTERGGFEESVGGEQGRGQRKRSRFEKETKVARKKVKSR
ncbi:hypothetical protein JAAARDRAFT_56592 [Jaapia argillacea MUCL 33604]|uniref:Neuroguidin n=1 Tax=Jaapia argillacea MUCL 33604 TaxID=933084 RepID=A0A067Q0A2_9AGAM|nr:hypothetical protein JAAARDRAFT_56592 [Jaapia argillacea MUCL 33604]